MYYTIKYWFPFLLSRRLWFRSSNSFRRTIQMICLHKYSRPRKILSCPLIWIDFEIWQIFKKIFWRFLFDWKTPTGYLGCIFIQAIIIIVTSEIVCTVTVLIFGLCYFTISFVSDLEGKLRQFDDVINASKNGYFTPKQLAKLKKILADFISFHGEAREYDDLKKILKHSILFHSRELSFLQINRSNFGYSWRFDICHFYVHYCRFCELMSINQYGIYLIMHLISRLWLVFCFSVNQIGRYI